MEEHIPYEIALLMVAKGFSCETAEVYERNTLAKRYEDVPKPTIWQALKWLREEHHISVEVFSTFFGWGVELSTAYKHGMNVDVDTHLGFVNNDSGYTNWYETYEAAVIDGIKIALEHHVYAE